MKILMSIDVEDWFQVENLRGAIPVNSWNSKESRVENNINIILEILSDNNTKATFFVLGWIAEKYKNLIKSIHNNGHEIASHGYGHDIVYGLSRDLFFNDTKKSKNILEDITGSKILGYRAPNFSITDWAIDVLQELDFKYDSSLFPAIAHDRYGKLKKYETKAEPFYELANNFYEVTLSCYNFLNKNIPWAGGGYFRLIPYWIFKRGIKKIIKKNEYFCFYIHPWEFDPKQPRVKNIKLQYKLRHYNNLKSTKEKFNILVKDFNFNKIDSILPALSQ